MNTANLQLEGLYMAVAAINNALIAKGLLSREEIDLALRIAEEAATGDYHNEQLSSSNRDAVAFPARLLQAANSMASATQLPPFSELAKAVGMTKQPFNDQM